MRLHALVKQFTGRQRVFSGVYPSDSQTLAPSTGPLTAARDELQSGQLRCRGQLMVKVTRRVGWKFLEKKTFLLFLESWVEFFLY